MTPDHEAALAKCRAWPHKSNTAACYLDTMARLDKAAELLEEVDAYWGATRPALAERIRAFLDERK